jgi:hypothetical protein
MEWPDLSAFSIPWFLASPVSGQESFDVIPLLSRIHLSFFWRPVGRSATVSRPLE